jgi:3-phenylpropionate/cinnamic acid dioxygenase small subunit
MDPDFELTVRLLADVHEIQQLSYEYCRLFDARRFKELAKLFAADGVWIGQTYWDGLRSYTGVGRSPQEIGDLLTDRLGDNPPAPGATSYHVISSPTIQVDGDVARGRLTWWQVQRSERDTPDPNLFGHYEDLYVRASGGWRIQKRVAVIDIPHVLNEIPDDLRSSE